MIEPNSECHSQSRLLQRLWHRTGKGGLIRYLIVGSANTLAGNAIFWIVWNAIGDVVGFVPSSIVSFFLSVLVSFSSHRYLVFEVRDRVSSRLLKFFLLQLANLALFTICISILRETTSLNPYVIYFLGSCVVIGVGLLTNRKWVFDK